ncbi:BQ5605_C006g04220 [Microbotryum silenes-dioicae]|uniref:BQ5605_C006g04220 protein n=1 Tax=Microbotryum silenes-dioicae TaxID=796604 RepID=A0A2X0N0K1_9BASI|nr:BQ5605_C006g04220 [Microbotryum silenes-dioicae]
MYQHTVVSAAPACGVHVPIRSHVQALWSPGTQGGPSQPRQVLGARVAPYHGLPWACSSARCWAPRGSTLLFVPLRSTESAPRRVMTTIQPTLALRHVYEPAVQLCRTDSVVSAMANSTLGSPHHHLRKGECAGLETRSNPSSPTHFSACCSQGKVRLPPPPQPNLEYRQLLQGSDSEAVAFRENARSYNNALSFTSLAALWDQTQVGTLGPPVFRVFGRLYHRLGALIPAVTQRPTFAQTWLIDPAEATDTRLGPDSADSHMQRSTLTKLESMLRTKNHFVREFASAKPRAGWDTAKEWILRLCLPPGRDRRTHNPPTSSTEMAMLICDSDTNAGDRGPQDLILQVHGDRCPDGRPKYQIQIDNGVQLREVLAGLGLDDEDEQEDEDRDNEDEDGEEGDEEDGDGERQRSSKGVEVASLAFTILCALLAKGDEYFSIPHCTHGPFLESVIYGYTPSRDRSTLHIRLHQENLHLTTTQGINGLAPNPIGPIPGCDGVRCQTWKASAAHHDDVRPRLTGNQGCTGADKACNRPDLIARVFEAKSGNKRHAGCFGDECKMNGFCFFAVLRVVFS